MDLPTFESSYRRQVREAVIGVDQPTSSVKSDSQGVIHGAIDARGHDFFFFSKRGNGVFPFHNSSCKRTSRHFDGRPRFRHRPWRWPSRSKAARGNFTGRLERALQRRPGRGPYCRRTRPADGAARFRRGTGSETRLQPRTDESGFHFVVGIERLKRGGVTSVIEWDRTRFFRRGG